MTNFTDKDVFKKISLRFKKKNSTEGLVKQITKGKVTKIDNFGEIDSQILSIRGIGEINSKKINKEHEDSMSYLLITDNISITNEEMLIVAKKRLIKNLKVQEEETKKQLELIKKRITIIEDLTINEIEIKENANKGEKW